MKRLMAIFAVAAFMAAFIPSVNVSGSTVNKGASYSINKATVAKGKKHKKGKTASTAAKKDANASKSNAKTKGNSTSPAK